MIPHDCVAETILFTDALLLLIIVVDLYLPCYFIYCQIQVLYIPCLAICQGYFFVKQLQSIHSDSCDKARCRETNTCEGSQKFRVRLRFPHHHTLFSTSRSNCLQNYINSLCLYRGMILKPLQPLNLPLFSTLPCCDLSH